MVSGLPRRRSGGLLRYIMWRVAFLPIGIFLIVTLSFFLTNVEGVNPGLVVLGTNARRSAVAAFNKKIGANLPLLSRFGHYLSNLSHGSFGNSYYSPNAPITSSISVLAISTVELVVASLVAGIVIGVALGAYSASRRGRFGEKLVSVIISLGLAVPSFLVAIILTYVVFYRLNVLPAPGGQLNFLATPPRTITGADLVDSLLSGQWSNVWDELLHMVIPVAAISLGGVAVFARVVKTTLGEAFDAPFTEFAKGCGVPRRMLFWQALRTTAAPSLTFLALTVAQSISGVALVEGLVNWQGLAQWSVAETVRQDIPGIEAFIVLSGVLTFVTFILADVAIRLVDPRTRETLR